MNQQQLLEDIRNTNDYTDQKTIQDIKQRLRYLNMLEPISQELLILAQQKNIL